MNNQQEKFDQKQSNEPSNEEIKSNPENQEPKSVV